MAGVFIRKSENKSHADVQAQLLGFDAVGQVDLQRAYGASPAHTGAQADGDAYSPALSMDGRLVAVDSDAHLDPAADPNTNQDIYVHVNF